MPPGKQEPEGLPLKRAARRVVLLARESDPWPSQRALRSALFKGNAIRDDLISASLAFRQKHSVAFFGIDGTLVVSDESRRAIELLVKQAAGIDQGSVRISMESAALSVAFDPRRTSYAAIQKSLEKKLAVKHLTLLPMRVMDEPAKLLAPS